MPRPDKQSAEGSQDAPVVFAVCGWNDCHDAWTEYLGSEELKKEVERVICASGGETAPHGLRSDVSVYPSELAKAIVNHLKGKD